jgi:hypothetical protein
MIAGNTAKDTSSAVAAVIEYGPAKGDNFLIDIYRENVPF